MSVVVGVDGSAASDAAVVEAALTAHRRGVPLHVVHYEAHELGDSMTQVRRDVAEAAIAAETLEALAERWRERGIDVVVHLVEGPPSGAPDAILRVAEETDAQLIVLGWKPRSKFEEVVLGSVAREVRKRAQRPIMTVPAKGT